MLSHTVGNTFQLNCDGNIRYQSLSLKYENKHEEMNCIAKKVFITIFFDIYYYLKLFLYAALYNNTSRWILQAFKPKSTESTEKRHSTSTHYVLSPSESTLKLNPTSTSTSKATSKPEIPHKFKKMWSRIETVDGAPIQSTTTFLLIGLETFTFLCWSNNRY